MQSALERQQYAIERGPLAGKDPRDVAPDRLHEKREHDQKGGVLKNDREDHADGRRRRRREDRRAREKAPPRAGGPYKMQSVAAVNCASEGLHRPWVRGVRLQLVRVRRARREELPLGWVWPGRRLLILPRLYAGCAAGLRTGGEVIPRGRRTVKVVPAVGDDSTLTDPSCASAIC